VIANYNLIFNLDVTKWTLEELKKYKSSISLSENIPKQLLKISKNCSQNQQIKTFKLILQYIHKLRVNWISYANQNLKMIKLWNLILVDHHKNTFKHQFNIVIILCEISMQLKSKNFKNIEI
jgi:hypothetical protein